MEYFALQRTGVMDTQTRAPQSATQLAPICGARERVMGAQFTGLAFTGVLTKQSIAISMDGKGAWRDNVFVERLWHTIKYE